MIPKKINWVNFREIYLQFNCIPHENCAIFICIKSTVVYFDLKIKRIILFFKSISQFQLHFCYRNTVSFHLLLLPLWIFLLYINLNAFFMPYCCSAMWFPHITTSNLQQQKNPQKIVPTSFNFMIILCVFFHGIMHKL